jgi:hypothetical protein
MRSEGLAMGICADSGVIPGLKIETWGTQIEETRP